MHGANAELFTSQPLSEWYETLAVATHAAEFPHLHRRCTFATHCGGVHEETANTLSYGRA